jgi:ABC-2 type transport system permease protein
MTGIIFRETLRRGWRPMLYWGIGMALLALYMLVAIQDMDTLGQYAAIVESMPPALLALFGSEVAAIGSPDGFIAFGFFGFGLLFLAVYAVSAGLNITANEEEDGILDSLLAQPVPRWRVMIEKFLAYLVLSAGIVVLSYAGLLLGMQFSALPVNTGRMAQAAANMLPSMLLMTAFTMFAAVVVRRRAVAMGLAAVFVVGSYFVDFLGGAASGSLADALRALSFFSYYDATTVMQTGLNWGSVALLLGVTAALVAGALWFFQRRDVGV